MHQMIVRHNDLTTEKVVFHTKNPDCEYVKKLVRTYEKQGFVVRFADVSHMDTLGG